MKITELAKNEEWIKRLLFASVFIEANKLQTIFDRYHEEVSSKQWLLMVIASSFENPPMLSEVAEAMGCSRQNVKKIAMLLEKKEFLVLQKDVKDGRTLRICLTQKFETFAKSAEIRNSQVLEVMFQEFSQEELKVFWESSMKMSRGIEALDTYFAQNLKEKDGQ